MGPDIDQYTLKDHKQDNHQQHDANNFGNDDAIVDIVGMIDKEDLTQGRQDKDIREPQTCSEESRLGTRQIGVPFTPKGFPRVPR